MSATRTLSIVSVCRTLPHPGNPSAGIFVLRRLEGMAQNATVSTLQPVPWFPVVAPLPAWAREAERQAGSLRIRHAPMFYIPRFMKSLDGLWLYRSILRHLRRLRQHTEIDAIDAHFGYPEGVGALLAGRRLGIPTFVTLRGFETEYLESRLVGSEIRYLLRNVHGCICVSHFLKKLAIENGARPESTCVIHNAIDRGQFCPADKHEARRELGLDLDAPIVISVGHLIRRKRHNVLLEAFAEVRSAIPAARLFIIGNDAAEPEYARELYLRGARPDLAEAVTYLGNLPAREVSKYLAASDVFALATQREGCCNAILEALACGLPVVTTDAGDNRWFVEDGKNGYIVPVDNPAETATAIKSVLTRTDWDRRKISAELNVLDWKSVGRSAVEFMADRLALREARLAASS
jgi:teichuronic acid biosynthesis glycosyltransferase TuaC